MMYTQSDELDIDGSWLKRLGIDSPAGNIVFSHCNYWQRGGEEDLAFLYQSDTLTLISCDPEIRSDLMELQLTTLYDYVTAHQDLALEVYIDDRDFYLPVGSILAPPQHAITQLYRDTHEAEILSFLAGISEEDVVKADFELDSDFFYGVYIEDKLAGLLASYCGIEPFESLSILVGQSFRGLGLGKSLLTHLVQEARSRERVVRYRTNVNNRASIRLCESLGFKLHSKIQILAKC